MGRGSFRLLPGKFWGRKSTAILIPLQVILLLLITALLVGWFAHMQRRNHRSWDAVVDRMSPESRMQWSLSPGACAETVAAIWMKNPRAAFRDSGVLLEMADYAERNAASCDLARLQAVRTAALQLRTASARVMVRRIWFR